MGFEGCLGLVVLGVVLPPCYTRVPPCAPVVLPPVLWEVVMGFGIPSTESTEHTESTEKRKKGGKRGVPGAGVP